MGLKTLSLTASPTTVSVYRVWSWRHSHSLHHLPPSPYIVYGLEDTLTHRIAYHRHHIPYMVLKILSLDSHSPTSALASTQSRLRRRRTMRNRGWYPSRARGNPWKSGQYQPPTPAASHWKRRESIIHLSTKKKLIFVVTLLTSS